MRNTSIKPSLVLLLIAVCTFSSCQSQSSDHTSVAKPPRKDLAGMAAAANYFLNTLSEKQKGSIQFSFDADERYNWHYIPKSRKGLPLKELSDVQRKAAMALLRTALSDTGYQKTIAITQLEAILRESE